MECVIIMRHFYVCRKYHFYHPVFKCHNIHLLFTSALADISKPTLILFSLSNDDKCQEIFFFKEMFIEKKMLNDCFKNRVQVRVKGQIGNVNISQNKT